MWQPENNFLSHIALLLDNASQGDTLKQLEIQKALNEYQKKLVDFSCYLSFILSSEGKYKENVQTIAGLVLKNYIHNSHRNIAPEMFGVVKTGVFQALGSKFHLVRATSGTILSMIVEISDAANLPEIFMALIHSMESSESYIAEAALGAFKKICEDHSFKVETCPGNPLSILLPKFIGLMDSPTVSVRVNAIYCVNSFIRPDCHEFHANLQSFMSSLSKRADCDTDAEVRKAVCKSLVSLMESFKNQIAQSLPYIYEYVLKATTDEDLSVSLEACEFWLALSEMEDLTQSVVALYPRLIPILMNNMKYDESDAIFIDHGDDDEFEDKDEDIKPRHHRTRTHEGKKEEPSKESEQQRSKTAAAEDDDDEDFEEDDDDESYREWNLRKCSAATIDSLSYGEARTEFLQVFLPVVNQKICASDWLELESGILALGAVSEGLREDMEQHLHQLIPFLFNNLKHPKSLIRSITCWTLSRYSTWVTRQAENPQMRQAIFVPFLEGILKCILDRSKKVQEAACGAFSTFGGDADNYLIDFLPIIINAFGSALQKYQKKNMILLYDAIQVLCESAQNSLNRPEFASTIVPIMMSQMQTMDFNDRRFFAFYECLGSLASALEQGFMPFAQICFVTSLQVISNIQMAYRSFSSNPSQNIELPDKDYMMVAIDLLGNMVQGLRKSFSSILMTQYDVFFSCLMQGLVDPNCDVRQSTFGLVGDLAQHSFESLEPRLKEILQEIFKNMLPNSNPPKLIVTYSLASNVVWALGEIALHNGSYIEPFCEVVLVNLTQILMNQDQSMKSLTENAAITMGRIGKACPLIVAPHLPKFINQWCFLLTKVRLPFEKQSAFEGLCDLIMVNPRGVMQSFPYLCHAFCGYNNPPPPQLLEERFKRILLGYKELLGSNWDSFLLSNEEVRLHLTQRFQIQ